MLIVSPLFWTTGNLLSAAIRGTGDVKYPALILILAAWFYRIPAAWLVCVYLNGGAEALTLVNALLQVVYAVFFGGYLIVKIKQQKKLQLKENFDPAPTVSQ